ncbi:Lysine histidine transporter 1 [Glycine max]|nr:Lysine histidine transporter 1 [Glycine max]
MGTQSQTPIDNNYLKNATEEELQRQKAINDWLPITSSRNAKWWYSAFHNVTAMVGAGVLSLPYAMGPGVTVLILSWIITLYTLWQMVEMHEMVPGKRFDRYHELGQYAFGEKLGLYIVVPQQLVVEIGVNIVYMVTGGKSLQKFHDTVCDSCKKIKLTFFIMIFASVHFVLSHLPNFNSISGVSLAAAVMSLSYSTIAWAASAHKGVQENVEYGYKAKSTSGTVFNFFSALGDVAFAYAGHNVVLEIQATIPSTPEKPSKGDVAFAYAGHNVVLEIQATIPSSPEKPSKGPMWRGVLIAYLVVALCYFPVALIGYWVFGNSVDDNILITLNKPTWLIVTANMFVVIHVIGSYQLYAMPVFDMIETVMVKQLRFKPTWQLRFVVRNLPCIIWLAIYKPKKFSLSWITNWS